MEGSISMNDSDGSSEPPNIIYEYTKKDINILRDMWDEIFADPDEFTNYYFNSVCRSNNILVAYEGELPVGMVHLNTYNVNVYGKEALCTYIVGVCVRKKYRNKGIMRSMLKKIIADTKTMENSFFFLMPEIKEYYTGLGFQTIYETFTADCGIKNEDMTEESCFKEFHALGLGLSSLSDYDDEALILLADRINESLGSEYNVYSKRDVCYLKKMCDEHTCQNGNVCVIKRGSDDITGLFSYAVYDGVLYAERVELYDMGVNDMLTCIIKKCLENACVGSVITLPYSYIDAVDINIHGMNVMLKAGHGIMAYIKENTKGITYEMLKGSAFFDEIV